MHDPLETDPPETKGIRRYFSVLYLLAIILYAIPVVLLGIFILGMLLELTEDMHLWVAFLMSLFPAGILGALLSNIGLYRLNRTKNKILTIAGAVLLLLGLVEAFAGLLGFGLIYIVTS